MIRITTLKDLRQAVRVPPYIAESMEQQLLRLCSDYQTDDIADFGAFYYVESATDTAQLTVIGFTLENAIPEFTEQFTDDSGTHRCTQRCYIVSDDFAIYFFTEDNLLPAVDS